MMPNMQFDTCVLLQIFVPLLLPTSWSLDQNLERTKQLIVISQYYVVTPFLRPLAFWTNQNITQTQKLGLMLKDGGGGSKLSL